MKRQSGIKRHDEGIFQGVVKATQTGIPFVPGSSLSGSTKKAKPQLEIARVLSFKIV